MYCYPIYTIDIWSVLTINHPTLMSMCYLYINLMFTISVVATTHWNSTCSMLTSTKLLIGYLVVGITRELDKKPSLHCSSIYINTRWFVLQQYLLALMSMPLPHVLLLRPPCHIHVPWRHTLNLHCTCVHHVYTMRNSCPLTSSLILTTI